MKKLKMNIRNRTMNMNLLTPKEVAQILKINYNKVLELIALGKIEAYKVGGSYRISSIALNKYLQSVKVKSFWKK